MLMMRPVALAKLFVPTHTPFLVSSPVAFKFLNVLVLNIAEKLLAGNLYIPHNRRTPLQAEEALGPISIHRVSRGVIYIYNIVLNIAEKLLAGR
jgi:hypothetical protein